jgi:hypothetical protein
VTYFADHNDTSHFGQRLNCRLDCSVADLVRVTVPTAQPAKA